MMSVIPYIRVWDIKWDLEDQEHCGRGTLSSYRVVELRVCDLKDSREVDTYITL